MHLLVFNSTDLISHIQQNIGAFTPWVDILNACEETDIDFRQSIGYYDTTPDTFSEIRSVVVRKFVPSQILKINDKISGRGGSRDFLKDSSPIFNMRIAIVYYYSLDVSNIMRPAVMTS